MRKKSRLITLVFLVLLLNIMSTVAQPVPIGETVQSGSFESNPSAGNTSGVVGLVGNEANARDGDFGTNVNWRIGGAVSSVVAYLEMQVFENIPSVTFIIGWVDMKINYRASATTNDRYRIVYQVGSSANQTLQDWTSGTSAKFDYNGAQDERVWSNIAEPNDGVWDWADIGNLKVRVETSRVGTEESPFNRFYLHEIWLTIYEGLYPPSGTVSTQPRLIANVHAGDIFFLEVFVTDVTNMHGFQFEIQYNTLVLTAVDYFTYNPFIMPAPSEIADDPWGNGTGYVALAFSSFYGDGVGFTGSEPVVRIYFIVDADGTSLLHFSQSILSTTLGESIPHTVNDGVFATNPIHDVAITDLKVNTTQAMPGETVAINVTAMNQGTFSETFDVTILYDTTVIGTQTVTSLDAAYSTRLFFVWDTTLVPFGHYQIRAEATIIPDETETGDNMRFLSGIVVVGRHDIAVTEVVRAYPTTDMAIPTYVTYLNVTQGEKVYINVTVMNQGTYSETFNVTAFYWSADETALYQTRLIGKNTSVTLNAGDSFTFSYMWNTIDAKFRAPRFTPDGRWIYYNNTLCEVRANVTSVQYEKGNDFDNTGNNVYFDRWVNVTRSTPEAIFYINPLEPFVGQPVEFDARLSRTSTGTTLEKFEWSFGDGTIETYVVGLNATLPHRTTHSYVTAGAYRVNLTVWNNAGFNNTYSYPWPVQVHIRDNAILSVAANATTVPIGDFVAINVTIKNEGGQFEPWAHVTVYFNETAIDTQPVLGLHPGYTKTLMFSLNTTGLSPGTYAIRAVAEPLPYEIDTHDNTLTDGVIMLFSWDYVFKDHARGTTLKVNTEHKFFQFIAPTKDYGIKHDAGMTVRTNMVIIFFEDTEIKLNSITIDTRIEFCVARAQDMQTGETYWLLQRPKSWKVGDTNYDGVVDILDVGVISAHWFPNPPQGTLGYDPDADINNDGAVDILDIAVVSGNWTK